MVKMEKGKKKKKKKKKVLHPKKCIPKKCNMFPCYFNQMACVQQCTTITLMSVLTNSTFIGFEVY